MLISICFLASVLIVTYLNYQTLFPQSVIAKSGLTKPSVLNVFKSLIFPDPLIPFVFLVSVISPFLVFREKNIFLKIITYWGLIYLVAYLAGRPKIWSWYGMPMYYVMILLASITLAWALSFISNVTHKWHNKSMNYVYQLIVTVILAAPVMIWGAIYIQRGASGVEENIYQPLQQWGKNIDAHKTILASDIGAIGYYSNATIYDTAGLVSPSMLNYQSIAQAIIELKPDYLFLNATYNNVSMLNKPAFSEMYTPVIRFSQLGVIEKFSMNQGEYEKNWVQDYIVFQKK